MATRFPPRPRNAPRPPCPVPMSRSRSASATPPAKRGYARFHYRQIAASHMMKAADELPARSQAYAAVLCQGTRFVINDAPDVAAKMYRRYVETGAVVPFSGSFGRNARNPTSRARPGSTMSRPGGPGNGCATTIRAACWPPACWRWRPPPRVLRCGSGARRAGLSRACPAQGPDAPYPGRRQGRLQCPIRSARVGQGHPLQQLLPAGLDPRAQAQVGSDRSRVDEGVAPGAIQVFQQRQAHHAGRVAQQHRRRYSSSSSTQPADTSAPLRLAPASTWTSLNCSRASQRIMAGRSTLPAVSPGRQTMRALRCSGGAPWPHPRGR